MSKSGIVRTRMSGGRLKEAGLPLFILGDLAPLQDMVVDIAKWLFREEYGRMRSPSSFNQTHLKIAGLHSGSAVAEIDIGTARRILDGVPVPNQEHFEAAANRIVHVIELAEQGAERLNSHIPPPVHGTLQPRGARPAERRVYGDNGNRPVYCAILRNSPAKYWSVTPSVI